METHQVDIGWISEIFLPSSGSTGKCLSEVVLAGKWVGVYKGMLTSFQQTRCFWFSVSYYRHLSAEALSPLQVSICAGTSIVMFTEFNFLVLGH